MPPQTRTLPFAQVLILRDSDYLCGVGQPQWNPAGIHREQNVIYWREAHLLRHQMQVPESLRATRESPDRMREPNRSVLLESRLQRGSRALHPKASGEVRNLLALRSAASARSVIPLARVRPNRPHARIGRAYRVVFRLPGGALYSSASASNGCRPAAEAFPAPGLW